MNTGTAPSGQRIVVIGAGLVGLSCAWLLRQRGHDVLLIEASSADGATTRPDPVGRQGSEAALGVLMARVFHRSSGRGWRLRQRSLELWQDWRRILAERGRPIAWRAGLLLLANDQSDQERQRALLQDQRRPPGSLELWEPGRLERLQPLLPECSWGGLYSRDDGQLDPSAAGAALKADGRAAGMVLESGWIEALEACGNGWLVHGNDGGRWRCDWVVLAAGLGSTLLLPAELQPELPRLEPVLGQALELELTDEDAVPLDSPGDQRWPGAVNCGGINLIQRLSGDGGHRLWLGATLEPGHKADPTALEQLRSLGGKAPPWLQRARTIRHWQGWRARPAGQPAPLLLQPAAGLLLASGHYRNGVLLAPASAEWVAQQIGH